MITKALPYLGALLVGWRLIASAANDIVPDPQLPSDDSTAWKLFQPQRDQQRLPPNCPGTPDSSWILFNGFYYNTLDLAVGDFYHGGQQCALNDADVAFPAHYDEWQFLLTLARSNLQDFFVGIHLPIEMPLSTQCKQKECEQFLKLANGSDFRWAWWMKDSFDRDQNQPRCYRLTATGPQSMLKAVSAHCYQNHAVTCITNCPKEGPPTFPSPLTVRSYLPKTPPMMLHRRSRTRRLEEPNFNQSLKDFLAPPKINHSQLSPWTISPGYADPAPEIEPTRDPKDLIAYDCTDPLDIQAYQMATQAKSCLLPAQPQHQRNSSYFLLQKSDTIKISLRQCQVTETTIPFYCGAWSHQTFAYPFLRIEEKLPISPRECEDLWDTWTFVDPHKNIHHLIPNDTTRIYYLQAGASDIEDGTIHCQGGRYDYKGVTYENMVVAKSVTIQLLTQPASIDDNEVVHVLRPDIFLSCSALDEKCVTNTAGTFIWKAPQAERACRYHKLRHVTGITVTDQFGVDTFMSTDNSLIRLLIKEATSRCGHVLLSTNYADLFLTADIYATIFDSPLPASEFSAYTYANQQDGFLYGFLTSYIRQEFQAVHHHACQRKLLDKQFNYDTLLAEQHGATDGDTAQLANGFFVTVAGEAWYRHRCRKIVVTAISLPECYSAIPVSLSPDDLRRYRFYHRLDNSTTLQLFVEPHSRRLTRRGIATECSHLFPALYKGLNGNWLALHPDVLIVEPPDILAAEALQALHHNNPEDFNFDTGGIYTREDIAQMESRLHAQRAVQDVGFTLGRSAQSHNWLSNSAASSSSFHPEHLFGPLAGLVSFSPLRLLWDTILNWGLFCSVLTGIYYLVYILHWLLNFGRNLFVSPVAPGQSLFHHLWATARATSTSTPVPRPFPRPRPPASPSPQSPEPPAPPDTSTALPQPDLTYPTPAPRSLAHIRTTSSEIQEESKSAEIPSHQPLLSTPPPSYQDMRQDLKHLTLQQLPRGQSPFAPEPITYANIVHGSPLTTAFRPVQTDDANIYMNMSGHGGVRRRTSPKQPPRRHHGEPHYKTPRALYPARIPTAPRAKKSHSRRSRGSYEALFHMDDFPQIAPSIPDTTKPPPALHQSSPSVLDPPIPTSPTPSANTRMGHAGSSPGSTPPRLNSLTQQEFDRVLNRFDLLLSSIPEIPPTKKAQQLLRASLMTDIGATYEKLKLQTLPLKDLDHWEDMIKQYQNRLHTLLSQGYQSSDQ